MNIICEQWPLLVILGVVVLGERIFCLIKNKKTEDNTEKIKQSTFLYCDCGAELISTHSFLSDTEDDDGDNHVVYRCKKCGRKHDYNFDIAPIPVSW